MFERVTIIGFGLIGGSLALGMRARGLCGAVHVVEPEASSREYALSRGMADRAEAELSPALKESRLILLCAPPSAVAGLTENLKPYVTPQTLVMDVSSVKQPVVQAFRALEDICSAVPAHPVAGSDKFGPQHADGDLFVERRAILCPEEDRLSMPLTGVAREFWERLGSQVTFMPALLHDSVYGYVSHLPQLLSYAAKDALCNAVQAQHVTADDMFRRFMRLGQSGGGLWSDIFIANRPVMLTATDQYLSIIGRICSEFAAGMANNEPSESSSESFTKLFPRIAASCMVTALSIAEPEVGARLRQFSGTGLRDFIAPVTEAPEEDIEKISRNYRDILPVLAGYMQTIQHIRHLIQHADSGKLRQLLTEIQQRKLPL
jgi:prephenate dehydrogenase